MVSFKSRLWPSAIVTLIGVAGFLMMSMYGQSVEESPPATAVTFAARYKTATTRPTESVHVLLPHGAKPSLPQVRLSFHAVDVDGNEWPVLLQSEAGFEIVRLDGTWASGYGFDGSALQIGVGPDQSARQLEIGKDYILRGLPLSPRFSIPEVQAGEVKTIKLIVDDARVKKPEVSQPQIITGLVSDLPALPEGKKWVAAWSAPTVEKYADLSPEGRFELEVPALGGELMIGYEEGQLALAYISKVTKNELAIPEDAEWYQGDSKGSGVFGRRI